MVMIPGEPKGKGRPKFGKGFTYTPKDTVMYENLVKHEYVEQCGEKLEGQIKATIIAYYSIPKSVSKVKREKMLSGEIRPTKKPDADNVVKIILDSLNKIAYDDDSQVVEVLVSKYYANDARVILDFKQI